jgi:choline dehydrogenase
VGRNLQDHLASGWIVHTPTAVTMVDAEKPKQLLNYLLRRRGMLTSNVAEAVAMIHTEPGWTGPTSSSSSRRSLPRPRLHRAAGPRLHHRLRAAPAGQCRLAVAGQRRPTVAPTSTRTTWTTRRTCGACSPAASAPGTSWPRRRSAPHVGAPMRPETWPEDDIELEQLLRRYAETLYHPVGTARMGSDDESVVDEQLRVRGVAGLRVADAQ